jgi:transcriptional regulator with XRE-family HTH domain
MREARQRAGYSQERAAEAIGVSKPTLIAWEKARRTPSVKQLKEWATLCDAPWLLDLTAVRIGPTTRNAHIVLDLLEDAA